ncbi:hypothetical protein B4086_5582 [Bacillus cereus]|nr:hypothetical protein B4086_5582 [Bacillus cereus]
MALFGCFDSEQLWIVYRTRRRLIDHERKEEKVCGLEN